MIAGHMSDSDFRDAIREVKEEAPDLRAEP